MPKLETPGGEQLDAEEVNRRFAQAMAEPEPDEPLAAAPEPNTSDPEPAAPASDRRHDKPRTSAAGSGRGRGGGRRGKHSTKAAEPDPPAEGHFVRPVFELLQSAVIVGVMAPLPPGGLRVKVRLQAATIGTHSSALANAVDSAARHNAMIRRGVESLTMGPAGWVLPAVLVVAPFAAQSLALWRSPVDEDMITVANEFERQIRQQVGEQVSPDGPGDDASAAA